MRSFVIDALLICAALSCAGQASHEPYTFFKQSIGLQEGEISDIQRGKAVTKALSTNTPIEVAVFGAVFIHASLSFPETLASRLSSRLAAYGGFSPEKHGRLGALPGSLFLGESAFLASLLSRVGHSLAKCPIPSHS